MGFRGVILIAVIISIFLFILKGYFKKKLPSSASTNTQLEAEVEDIQASNTIGKDKLKLIPYKEALEASREFIYSIARIVMQKFSPQDKESLLTLGTRLLKAGVAYIHVVDVFKISMDKQRLAAKAASKDKAKDKGKGQ